MNLVQLECLNRATRLFLRTVIWLMACVAITGSLMAQPLSRSVVVIDESDPVRPAYFPINSAFRSKLTQGLAGHVTVYTENLDLSRFGNPQFEAILGTYLREKYREKSIDVIFANGARALELVLRLRPTLWSDVPVVFSSIDEDTATRMKLPSDVTGILPRRTFADAITAARALVPRLKRIALVGDSPERQVFLRPYKRDFPAFAAELELIDLTGLPMTELKKRVSVLPQDSAIVYAGIWSGGTIEDSTPEGALATIAMAANRPIVVDTEVWFGNGGAGGFLTQPTLVGERVAQLILRILNGESAANIPVAIGEVSKPIFDWRQLKRFGISAARLPPGSEVRFREPNVWEQYHWQIMIVASVLLVQTALIFMLLFEHRRRRTAEIEASQRMSELAHMNRHATAGEMSASIAHELNQPLGAILSNSETAEIILNSSSPDLKEVKEILADIKRNDLRASEIIRRLRNLLKKATVEAQDFDLNDVVREVFDFLSDQARARDVTLSSSPSLLPLQVRGDRIQLQQVILNLVVNGMEAMDGATNGARRITGRTSVLDGVSAEVTIGDSGPGIQPDKLKQIFEPFYTTKEHGMGMGLSIARTIVEAHDGRISVENVVGSGALFHVSLPLAKAH